MDRNHGWPFDTSLRDYLRRGTENRVLASLKTGDGVFASLKNGDGVFASLRTGDGVFASLKTGDGGRKTGFSLCSRMGTGYSLRS